MCVLTPSSIVQSYKSLALIQAEKFKQIGGGGVVVVGVVVGVGVLIKCRGYFEHSSTEFKVEPIFPVVVIGQYTGFVTSVCAQITRKFISVKCIIHIISYLTEL